MAEISEPFDLSQESKSLPSTPSHASIRLSHVTPMSYDYQAYKRRRSMSFEANPTVRKRQASRLLAKLKATINEFATRVGQQAVVVLTSSKGSPMGEAQSVKVFGASPLESVIRHEKDEILKELQQLQTTSALAVRNSPAKMPKRFDLPPLVIDGVPVTVEKMTQAQLRAFIPDMLKASLGRGKPGWGKEDHRPEWWPNTVPWQNVRSDGRDVQQKEQQSWTDALRTVIRSCYQYHDRLDLLSNEKGSEEGGDQAVMRVSGASPATMEQHLVISQASLQRMQTDGTLLLQQASSMDAGASAVNQVATLAEVAVSQESGMGSVITSQGDVEQPGVATFISGHDASGGPQLIDMYILTSDGGQVVIPSANQQVEVASVTQHGNIVASQETGDSVEVEVDINS
eukprot:m.1740 g.1740  ORF g.1740 m.1740 type:complete len:400 (+) comp7778_c0_seq1:1369-2568(+)